ncbi:MAG: ABC transporter ATP-binding protein [Deltaproteobacteria bacterium]|nr:ABC transporter ATP-binding protein [Deltaproteobacteria bacterium]MBW2395179.1 ABC transporter ATP-binding protein [Deltaproteobacteria bacterium]
MSQAGPAIEVRGLTRSFGPLVALYPLDLDVPSGSTLAVLGPNGAGKSTLLRLIAGLARPSAGTIRLGATQHEGAPDDRLARRRRIGLIGHATFLYPALTARENLILAGRLWSVDDPEARAATLLDEQDLLAAADRPIGGFSRGMAQRVAIARALVHDPAILLLDEPFTGLDPTAADRLTVQLKAARDGGRTSLLVTHDLSRAAALADRTLILKHGVARPIAPEALSSRDNLDAAYREAIASPAPS